MDLKLVNKVAVVTGASRGIGKSITEKLISSGCKVAMISRNIDDLELIKKNLNSDSILCFQADIKNTKQVEDIIHLVYKHWGEINILINNAGITKDKIILRLSEEDWQEVIDVNLKGCYNTIKAVSKYMIKNKNGKIINISSVIGQIGNSGQSNYAASKSGIEGITRALAVELGSRNININCIAPGYIETSMTNQLDEKVLNKMKQNIPLNKLGAVEDIANLVCYLSSDLSRYITGKVINVDGGMTIK